MKILAIFLTAGFLFSAAAQSTSESKKPEPNRKVTKAAESVTIPPDATPMEDGSFRYTDKDGKKWIYRKTPWGVSKAEERPVSKVVENVSDDPIKSEDLGETVRFTRPTPWGPQSWTSRKNALNSYEKSIWERDQQKKQDGGTKSHDAAKQD